MFISKAADLKRLQSQQRSFGPVLQLEHKMQLTHTI